jgi:mono/diheme cytochrome c family protein
VREAVRKPYIIYGYMWSNSIRVADRQSLREQGLLPRAKWTAVSDASMSSQLQAGEEIFQVACQSCHTVQGYNGIQLMVRGWSRPLIRYSLDHLDELKGYMPPFVGSRAEREALADWLRSLAGPMSVSATEHVARRLQVPPALWAQLQPGASTGASAAGGRKP